MSHLQANIRTNELFITRPFRVPKCLLLTVIFVSKAADLWVLADGLLSWCSFHFQLEVKATPGQKTIHYYPQVSSLRNKNNCK
jgi:hypothetical protein